MQLMSDAIAEAALPVEVEEAMRMFLDGMSTFLINRTQ
jgi:hypothetical protein